MLILKVNESEMFLAGRFSNLNTMFQLKRVTSIPGNLHLNYRSWIPAAKQVIRVKIPKNTQ